MGPSTIIVHESIPRQKELCKKRADWGPFLIGFGCLWGEIISRVQAIIVIDLTSAPGPAYTASRLALCPLSLEFLFQLINTLLQVIYMIL